MADFSTITAKLTCPHEVIGPCLLVNADCLAVLPLLEAGSVDAVVTSPPYNLCKKWWDCGANGIHKELAAKFANEWYPDEVDEPEYQEQQRRVVSECERISCGCVCYNHKVRHAFKRKGQTFHPIQWLPAERLWVEIIWDRGPGPAVNCRRPTMADERIFVFNRPAAWNDLKLTTIWRMRAGSDQDHPCAFPLELPVRLIQSFTNEGMVVADPYSGSGTTGVACIRTGRRFIGIELDAGYYRIACDRIRREWEQWQGGPMFAPKAKASALF